MSHKEEQIEVLIAEVARLRDTSYESSEDTGGKDAKIVALNAKIENLQKLKHDQENRHALAAELFATQLSDFQSKVKILEEKCAHNAGIDSGNINLERTMTYQRSKANPSSAESIHQNTNALNAKICELEITVASLETSLSFKVPL